MPPTALIVEDELALRKIYRRVLENIGFVVHEAANGLEALEQLAKHRPDIIFLDILLPKVNGLEVLEHMQADPQLNKIFTVIVSSNDQYRKYGDSLPNSMFIPKPIMPLKIQELATDKRS